MKERMRGLISSFIEVIRLQAPRHNLSLQIFLYQTQIITRPLEQKTKKKEKKSFA